MYDKSDYGADIARELGITRQAVSNTLKRAMKKVYYETKRINPDQCPFETATQMMKMFEVSDSEEVQKFFHLFPPDIRQEIKEDVISSGMRRNATSNDLM
jgi:DNA-binding transcriptional regulator LsrR (DeoR family)